MLWSYALAALGLVGLHLQGSGRWYGWAFTILAQSLWIAYSFATEQYGFLLGTAGYVAVATRNLLRWRRLHVAGSATPGSTPLPEKEASA